jgi:hypothetical protein
MQLAFLFVVGSDIPQTLLHWRVCYWVTMGFFLGTGLDEYRLAGVLFGFPARMRCHFSYSMANSRIKTLLTLQWMPLFGGLFVYSPESRISTVLTCSHYFACHSLGVLCTLELQMCCSS